MRECTFKPKINSNIKVPTDRSLLTKSSYTKKFNDKKQAQSKNQSDKNTNSGKQKQVGVFKNYSSAAQEKKEAAAAS